MSYVNRKNCPRIAGMGFVKPHGVVGSRIATAARIILGLALVYAGTAHLTFARTMFLAQVPRWLPFDPDAVVFWSGIIEIALGLALVIWVKFQRQVGLFVALFLVAVYPGNIAQFVEHTNAFGLSTDLARGIRLLVQPLLVLWVLWTTRALSLF